MLKETLENLYRLISEGQLESDARRALSVYRKMSGTAYQDDPSYESRMSLFTEWFMLDSAKTEDTISPIEFYIAGKQDISDEERQTLDALKRNVHDVFWVKWASDERLKVWAMYLDKYFYVDGVENAGMFRKHDLFEARIVDLNGKWLMLNGFCHHPAKTYKFISAQMKRIRKSNGEGLKEFIHKLSSMSLMSERARNIDVNEIYKTEAA
ncbi:MAG: hypothetical protein OEZ32_07335 [Nitrospinota bacterium]|nr:hypothetical protein [Nitrospinota bacterium]